MQRLPSGVRQLAVHEALSLPYIRARALPRATTARRELTPFPTMTTTFLSFTAKGGRIGRIVWNNGDEEAWGKVRWDRWWPAQPPTISSLQKFAAKLAADLAQTFNQLSVELQHAGKAFEKLTMGINESCKGSVVLGDKTLAKVISAKITSSRTDPRSDGGEIPPGTNYRV